MAESSPVLRVAWPQLQVLDLSRTLEYYRDKLGFETKWVWGDPPRYANVTRDGVSIHLVAAKDAGKPNTECTDMYIAADPVDALFVELKGRGAEFIEEIGTREYGMRDFAVVDCNGFRIAFGQEVE